jgi:hypothetical protein
MNFKKIWDTLKTIIDEYSNDKVPKLAAALSYYTVFFLAPLLVIAIEVAGAMFGAVFTWGEARWAQHMVRPVRWQFCWSGSVILPRSCSWARSSPTSMPRSSGQGQGQVPVPSRPSHGCRSTQKQGLRIFSFLNLSRSGCTLSGIPDQLEHYAHCSRSKHPLRRTGIQHSG